MPFAPSFGVLEDSDSVPAPTSESPFRIAVLGDFRGRGSQGEEASPDGFADRRPAKIQHDKLDDVLASFKIELQLSDVEGEDVELTVSSLDDFHPDQIHEKLDRFALLSDDEDKAKVMAAILHHPQFQAVESAWRGLDWLLRRAQKGGVPVEVVIYDISQDEWSASLNASDDLVASAIFRTLIEKATQGPKGQPWSLFVGLYVADRTGPDAQLLGRMAKIAQQANAPFLAAAHARVLEPSYTPGAEADAAWTALRRLPEASYLGLASPRFLLRLPYGENTQSIERFSFDEFPMFKKKIGYLWGNPALACAALLAQSFGKEGWAFRPGSMLDLDGMPLHAYIQDDEEEATVAESWLLRPTAEKILKAGIMPLLGVKGRNALQLYRFTSLALPPKDQSASELAGSWGQQGMAPKTRDRAKPPLSVSAQFGPVKAAEKTAAVSAAPAAVAAVVAEPAAVEEALDPELAALMAQMDAPPAAPEPAPEPALDPELAALMAQLEGPPAAAEPPAEAPAEEALDPELAALMKQLEGGS
jgi:type VI secretion system ImpB/VipA family protein